MRGIRSHRPTIVPARALLLVAVALLLSACEVGLFAGYGLPGNEACRDAAVLPSRPLSTDCLDSLAN